MKPSGAPESTPGAASAFQVHRIETATIVLIEDHKHGLPRVVAWLKRYAEPQGAAAAS